LQLAEVPDPTRQRPAAVADPVPECWELAYLAIRAHVSRSAAPGSLARLVQPGEPDEAGSASDRAFRSLARLILGAGLHWSVLSVRWQSLVEALNGFALDPVAALDEADVCSLLELPGMLRNPAKLWALAENARALRRLLDAYGGLHALRQHLASVPPDRAVTFLVDELVHVGPVLASRWMHALGIDCHVPHPAVRRVLRRLGAIEGRRGVLAQQALAASVLAGYEPGPMAASMTSAVLFCFATGMLVAEPICGPAPRCGRCPAALHCRAWRQRRTDAGMPPG
jgi:hypothetical protein